MPNILDILARAQSLMNETALNSITPPRAGGIMYDTLLVLNQMQLEGASLLISKVYASVSAMEADTTPTSDLTGRALKPGQLVVIVTSDTSSSDMGSEYRYNGPGSWTYVGKVGGLPLDTVPTQNSTKGITSGGVYAAQAAIEEDITQLVIKLEKVAIPTTETGKYIKTSGDPGTTLPSPTSSDSYRYMKFPVVAGDLVYVNAKGSSNPRTWCFVDSNDVIISRASYTSSQVVVTLTAPTNSAYVVINDNSNSTSYYLSKDSMKKKMDELEGEVGELTTTPSLPSRTTILEEDIEVAKKNVFTPTTLSGLRVGSTSISNSSGDTLYYLPIIAGQTIRGDWGVSSGYVRYGISAEIPASGVEIAEGYGNGGTGNTGHSFTATINGYVVVSFDNAPSSVSFYRTNNAIGGVVAKLVDDLPQKVFIMGNGSTSVTTNVTLSAKQRYIAHLGNFKKGTTNGSYLVFRIKCGERTICEYFGTSIVPDKVYFELGATETQIAILSRTESGVDFSVTFEKVDNPGIFDFNDYEKELVRIYNARKTFDSSGVTPFVMLHFSDLHADSVRLKRLLSYYDTMIAGIDEILHTGDAIRETVTADSFDFWDECGAQKVLNCIGNHDVWTTEEYTPAENFAYNTYFKPYIDGGYWGAVVQPDAAEANGLCYYYKDFASKKIRLIVLDYRNPAGQISWLTDVLSGAVTGGLAVIIAVHYPIELTTPFKTAFDISQFASLGTPAASSFVTAVDAFISNGGEFVCWLTGHTHKDFCGVKEISGRKQVAVCIDCAALRNDGLTRYRGEQTKSQDCFNMLSVNVNTKILTIWRVGEDTDGLQRHKGSMCINYQSGELIYTD